MWRSLLRRGSTRGGPVPLTAERYGVPRHPGFARVGADDLAEFSRFATVVTEDLEAANTDWLRTCRGQSGVRVLPKDVDGVAGILRHCASRGLAVVPQGGGTGLVGGGVPVHDEVMLSLQRLTEVEVDPLTGIVRAGAGVVLQTLIEECAAQGLAVPVDLGAKGSCQVGGVVSTNAGGLRLLRYGSLHGSVVGIEAVLADGTIVRQNPTGLRKDNTGYDWKQLLIGGEGTLGIVTAVHLACPPEPKTVNVAVLALPDFEACLRTLQLAKAHLGEVLSAFEFFDAASRSVVDRHFPTDSSVPSAAFHVLVETRGSNEDHDLEKLENFLAAAMEGEAADGVVAASEAQKDSLWALRERIPEACLSVGHMYAYDVSVPVRRMYGLVEDVRARLGERAVVTGFGHLGDGNLHIAVAAERFDVETEALLEPFIFEKTATERGSISAEHGIGFWKKNDIHYSQSPESVALMRKLKHMFDPAGILNPYKLVA